MPPPQLPDLAQHLVLGVLPDRTSVEDDHARLGGIFVGLISPPGQFAHDQLRVELVHLTAHRLNVEGLVHRGHIVSERTSGVRTKPHWSYQKEMLTEVNDCFILLFETSV